MGKELGKIIRLSIFFYIIYLIFTNFGTFLIIIFVLFVMIYFFIYKKLKSKNQFHFKSQGYNNNNNFNGFNPNTYSGINDIKKAKDFFGFTSDPTKDEIKKTYKILARKYHPDINDHDDSLMKDLNHYKDILIKTYDNKK